MNLFCCIIKARFVVPFLRYFSVFFEYSIVVVRLFEPICSSLCFLSAGFSCVPVPSAKSLWHCMVPWNPHRFPTDVNSLSLFCCLFVFFLAFRFSHFFFVSMFVCVCLSVSHSFLSFFFRSLSLSRSFEIRGPEM